jgi:hypothetical protein
LLKIARKRPPTRIDFLGLDLAWLKIARPKNAPAFLSLPPPMVVAAAFDEIDL